MVIPSTAISIRCHAVHIIQAVIDKGKSLTGLLEQHQQQLPVKQHALLNQLCFGSLRWYITLDFWLRKLLKKPLKAKDRDLHFVLILGLFQLTHMDKPAHASLNETVNLSREVNKPWAAGLINGVLRNFQRQQTNFQDALQGNEALQAALPDWLVKKLKTTYPSQYQGIIRSLNERAPMTLRINPAQYSTSDYLAQLSQQGIQARPCALAARGVTLENPCDVNQLPEFFQGACSVQDEAAQLCTHLLQPKAAARVLDACCAPGGKTAALLEAYPQQQVIAVDADEYRQQRTRSTLDRLQLTAEIITADVGNLDDWWDGQWFDHILLDAPCSATGVIRRHPDIKHLRRPQDIDQLSELQSTLLHKLWSTLKPNGTLLYATCSILAEENTDIIRQFTAIHKDAEPQPPFMAGDSKTEFGCQLLPRPNGHDGFYYCLLTKVANK